MRTIPFVLAMFAGMTGIALHAAEPSGTMSEAYWKATKPAPRGLKKPQASTAPGSFAEDFLNCRGYDV